MGSNESVEMSYSFKKPMKKIRLEKGVGGAWPHRTGSFFRLTTEKKDLCD